MFSSATISTFTGAFSGSTGSADKSNYANGNTISITFSAHDSNSTYKDSGAVHPLSLALNFIIKA